MRVTVTLLTISFLLLAGCGGADEASKTETKAAGDAGDTKGGVQISVPGVNIDVGEGGGVTVSAPGVDVSTGKDGVNVKAPGVDLNAKPGGVDIDAPGVDLSVGPDGVKVKTGDK